MTTSNLTTAQALLTRTDTEGAIELRTGVWLQTQADFIAQQADWDEGDQAKHDDFTTAPYWINTNDGVVIAIHDAADLAAELGL